MVGHEQTDAHVGTIAKWIVGLLVLMVASIIAMRVMFVYLIQTDQPEVAPTPMEVQRVIPPGPLLQTNEPLDLREMRDREDQALHSYGWVNKEAGVVRIPIDRAMELVAGRGAGKQKQ